LDYRIERDASAAVRCAESCGRDAVVYADMTANLLPKVTMEPAMVIAIEQARTAGIAYHRP